MRYIESNKVTSHLKFVRFPLIIDLIILSNLQDTIDAVDQTDNDKSIETKDASRADDPSIGIIDVVEVDNLGTIDITNVDKTR